MTNITNKKIYFAPDNILYLIKQRSEGQKMTDILKLLLKTPTASGSEQQIGEVLSRYLETECGCDVAVDGLGNVIAAKRYKGS